MTAEEIEWEYRRQYYGDDADIVKLMASDLEIYIKRVSAAESAAEKRLNLLIETSQKLANAKIRLKEFYGDKPPFNDTDIDNIPDYVDLDWRDRSIRWISNLFKRSKPQHRQTIKHDPMTRNDTISCIILIVISLFAFSLIFYMSVLK